MYTFVCTGTPQHTSHSASKDQRDESCPTCGAPTLEVRTLDHHPLEIAQEMTIWFPGIYNGREGEYAKIASTMPESKVVELVQQRAHEDGEWAIQNGHVGDNEDVMRKMMAWVSDVTNIRQALTANPDETVDWICRDLANGSKWAGGSRD